MLNKIFPSANLWSVSRPKKEAYQRNFEYTIKKMDFFFADLSSFISHVVLTDCCHGFF